MSGYRTPDEWWLSETPERRAQFQRWLDPMFRHHVETPGQQELFPAEPPVTNTDPDRPPASTKRKRGAQ